MRKHQGIVNRPSYNYRYDGSISIKHEVKRTFLKISKIKNTVNVLLIKKVKKLNSSLIERPKIVKNPTLKLKNLYHNHLNNSGN